MADKKAFKFPSFDNHFGLLIEQISMLMQRNILNHLSDEGYEITFNELLILIFLASNKEQLSQKEISQKLFKDKSMITRFANNLEKIGLIKRVKNISDARSYNVSITKEGLRTVQKIGESIAPFEENFTKSINKSELQIFDSVLQKLLKHVTNYSSQK